MSELAAEYYNQRVETYGIEEMPDILNGEVHALSSPEAALAIRTLQDHYTVGLTATTQTLEKHLEDVRRYLIGALPGDALEEMPLDFTRTQVENSEFVRDCIRKLLVPSGRELPTGKIDNFQIEALSPAEVGDSFLKKLRKETNREKICNVNDDDGASLEAFLGLAARITSGSAQASTKGVVMARLAVHQKRTYLKEGLVTSPPAIAPIYRGLASPLNRQVVGKLMGRIRSMGRVAERSWAQRMADGDPVPFFEERGDQ